ncbi:MAG: hypothetical protein COC11_02805, partial [Candidatus Neomarinimicrobiota bacterium]
MNKRKTILAIGSIAIDTLETPHGNRKDLLGGSATYFSISAGLMAPVKLVGVVGNDFPEEGWKLFHSRNINTDNMRIQDIIALLQAEGIVGLEGLGLSGLDQSLGMITPESLDRSVQRISRGDTQYGDVPEEILQGKNTTPTLLRHLEFEGDFV